MVEEAIIEAALAAEKRTGVAAAGLLAVARVETASRAFVLVDGRREPLIRFEGHWFDRLLGESKREQARKAGLASPKPGAVRNPASQVARWALLAKAAAIDPEAAYAATSWGLGQIMGFHWKRLGYASASALADGARRSVEEQCLLITAFLKLNGLDRLLQQRRFADFARAYNGPGYRANRYEMKIAEAFVEAERMVTSLSETALSPAPSLPVNAKSRPSGWAGLADRLSAALRWINPRTSIPTGTRSFSTSTERSSALPTIRPELR